MADKYKTMKEYNEAQDKAQAEFDADKEHQKASSKLDKAFGYGRQLIGQRHTFDAPLTVRNTGPFNYVEPKDRPLKQRTWSEAAQYIPPEPDIKETGSSPKFAKGGKVLNNKIWSK